MDLVPHYSMPQVLLKFKLINNFCVSLQLLEDDSSLPLGTTCHRNNLRSARYKDEEARRNCASRSNREGSVSAGELHAYGNPEEEEKLQRLCQRCHMMASQLNRQAAALADTSALKVRNQHQQQVLQSAPNLNPKPKRW